MPVVSIVVPILNVEMHLSRCLESLLGQTLKEIEIILATDGGDECNAICNKYKQQDPHIKIIFQPGCYGRAVNLGIEIAEGEYIGIVEPDDWCALNMFEKLYLRAKQYDADVVKAGFYCVENRTLRKEILSKNRKFLNPDTDGDFFTFPSSIWSAIYRKDFLTKKSIKFIEQKIYYVDVSFAIETFLKTKKFLYLPEALYFYNCSNPNSSVKNKEIVNDGILVEEFLFRRLDTKLFSRIKKKYLMGLAARVKWNLNRIADYEKKCLFWKSASEYIRKINLSSADLIDLRNNEFKHLLVCLYQNTDYDDYKRK